MAPKQAIAEDSTAVIRSPSNLRTIFGSNADSKIISGAVATTLKVTPSSQRGFCRRRQLSVNIVDVDIVMRVFSFIFDASSSCNDIADLPGTALYDFCNALCCMSGYSLS